MRMDVKGNPTPEELAAVVSVLAATGSSTAEPTPAPVTRWNHRAGLLREPLPHGPGAWTASARTR